MILEFNDGLNPKAVVNATKLIVRDNYGHPIVVVLQYDDSTIAVYKPESGDNTKFNQLLNRLGEQGIGKVKEITV